MHPSGSDCSALAYIAVMSATSKRLNATALAVKPSLNDENLADTIDDYDCYENDDDNNGITSITATTIVTVQADNELIMS